MSSTITLQTVVNLASTQLELLPLSGVGGYTSEPALSLCNDTLQILLASPLDFKFNRAEMNMFVTSPNRQDYRFAGATFFSLGGNACGAGIDLATNNALTIASTTVTVKLLESYNGAVGDVCYILGTGSNYDSTFTSNGGNNAGFSGNTYTITALSADLKTVTATLTGSASGTSGSAGITDFSWLVGGTIIGIGNGGAILPTRHVEAVRDIQPYGYANIPQKVCVYETSTAGVLKIRFYPVVGSTLWGVNLVYQKKAPLATTLAGTWAPFPDELSYVYRQGFLARGYRYINSPRAEVEEQKFQLAIRKALGADERETADVCLYPADGIQTSDNNYWLL
jgi:hypothetical protein